MDSSQVDEFSVLSTRYNATAFGTLAFATASLLGRLLLGRTPPTGSDGPRLLNLGCGRQLLSGFVNADFFWYTLRRASAARPDWLLDLRYPLKCNADYWDGVFCEHALEHLYPHEALRLLHEIRRTLKPQAVLRVTVPDLGKYVRNYLADSRETGFSRWPTGAEALRSLTQNWGHLSLWDAELLGRFLSEAGFTSVTARSFRSGEDQRLLRDSPERSWETLYMEGKK